MILTGHKFRELLEKLDIIYDKRNITIFFKDIENGIDNVIDLKPYTYQFDKPEYKRERKPLQPFIGNIFNGKKVDLMSNNPYKEYTICANDLSLQNWDDSIFNIEKYELLSFDSFELLSDDEYVRTTMKLDGDMIDVTEIRGRKDQAHNYVVNSIRHLKAKEYTEDESIKGFISIRDNTNPRLEQNENRYIEKSWYINDIKEYYLEDEAADLENGLDIIKNNKLFKAALETLYPTLFKAYEKEARLQKRITL